MVVGMLGIAAEFFPSLSSTYWSFVLVISIGLPLLLTSACVFAALNSKYRRVKLVWGVFTLPRPFLLAGPALFDIGQALVLIPVHPTSEIPVYGLGLLIAGGVVSAIDFIAIYLAWRSAADIALGI
jgi:hypothetical protein